MLTIEAICAFYVIYIFQPQQQPDGLVAGSLDLIIMLVKVIPCEVTALL